MGKDEKDKDKIVGPKCEYCGCHRAKLIPVWEKRKTPYGYEMVKIFLCPIHFGEMVDSYDEWEPKWDDDNKDNNDDDNNDDDFNFDDS